MKTILFDEMDGFTKLWVDDTRPLPTEYLEEGCWTASPTAWEAIVKLELIQFEEVSLDHDLASFVGNKEITGYDILLWLAKRKHDGLYVPPKIRIHSANVVGVENMQSILRRYF
jgi:hypothetical protein